jgi:hypothetical protein
MYALLLSRVRTPYTVINDRVILTGDGQNIDIGSVEEIVKLDYPETQKLLDNAVKYHKDKLKRLETQKMEEQATKDGTKFGDFLLFMNPDFANYAGWWDIGMIFAKLMGYGTLETGVAFVTAMNSRIALYREANPRQIAQTREL